MPTIIGARPYYSDDCTDGVRRLCHAVKDGDAEAIREAAETLSRYVRANTVLIPIPGHTGYADYTLRLARAVQRECLRDGKAVFVVDLLRCNPHESFNTLKHKGLTPDGRQLGIRMDGFLATRRFRNAVEMGFEPILVDNVIDTGTTFSACMEATGIETILCIGDTGRNKPTHIPNPLPATGLDFSPDGKTREHRATHKPAKPGTQGGEKPRRTFEKSVERISE